MSSFTFFLLLLIDTTLALSLNSNEILCESHFRIDQQIGTGSYGIVYAATNTLTNEIVAIKELPLETFPTALREIEMMQKASGHENIVEYHCSEIRNNIAYIVMEYCPGGTVFQAVVDSVTGLSEIQARSILVQIAAALKHLFERRIIHRDLKADNLFISYDSKGEMIVKLADFGLALPLPEGKALKGNEGCYMYQSPERLSNNLYGFKSEVWAVGVMLYEILTCKHMFHSDAIPVLLIQMEPNSNQRRMNRLPSDISVEMQTLMDDLLEFSAKKRMSMSIFFQRVASLKREKKYKCFFC